METSTVRETVTGVNEPGEGASSVIVDVAS
jgi:hypothetical protein